MANQGRNGLFKWSVEPNPALEAFVRQAPAKFARALSLMVNQAAWDMRGEMESSIGRLMMVRRPSWVRRNLWVSKARVGSREPVAVVGSVRRGDKFEGWRAQQFGSPADRGRVPTLIARSKSKRKVVRAAARLMHGRDIPTTGEIVGTSSPGAVIAMMRILARRGDRRPFLIFPGEHPRFRGGLYQMRGRMDKRGRKQRIELLQSLESPNEQPRRIDWVNPAWRAYQASHTARSEFRKAMNKVNFRDALRRV